MGILKEAIREMLTKEAKKTGHDIRFIDSPTKLIESARQAKTHDIELVEKQPEQLYAPIVYVHNPNAYKESDILFLYVLDKNEKKVVGYISFSRFSIHVCRGCAFGDYNMWRDGCTQTAYGLNFKGLKEATEFYEKEFEDEKYQFIITKKGKAIANKIMGTN